MWSGHVTFLVQKEQHTREEGFCSWDLLGFRPFEVCTGMQQGAEATYNAEVDVENIDIITVFIPLPKALNFLKRVYMVMLYTAC